MRHKPPTLEGSLWRVNVPATMYYGTYTTVVRHHAGETARDQALQDYNRARARDGVSPVPELPALTTWHEITDHNAEINASGR